MLPIVGVVYKQEQAGEAIKLKPGLSLLKRASCFLDILKSFPWDLTMVRYCAKQRVLEFQTSVIRPKTMDIAHYLDHHVGPEFAYFMNPRALLIAKERYEPSEIFGDLNDQQSKPFAVLFREVFHASSGFNCRRTPNKYAFMENEDEFVVMIRKAQSRYFMEKHWQFCSSAETKVEDEDGEMTSSIEVELDRMWLAGAVGHISVRVKQQNYFVFITQVEPTVVLGVARVPSRNQKDIVIDEHDREEVIRLGFGLLKKGVGLQEAQSVFGQASRLILSNDHLHLYLQEKDQEPFIPNMLISTETNYDFKHLKEILFAQASMKALQRLWQLSQGFCKVIEFPKISRSGGVEDKPICVDDIEVFQLCLQLEPILSLIRMRFFAVELPALWWYIRDEILKPLLQRQKQKLSTTQNWNLHEDLM